MSPFEVTSDVAWATMLMLFVGSFWARTPREYAGVGPLLVVFAAAYTLMYGVPHLTVALLVAAGLLRSRRMGHYKPHSAVFGGVLGAAAWVASLSSTPTFWVMLAGSLLVLGDAAMDDDAAEAGDPPVGTPREAPSEPAPAQPHDLGVEVIDIRR
jgi:hypothetical protein